MKVIFKHSSTESVPQTSGYSVTRPTCQHPRGWLLGAGRRRKKITALTRCALRQLLNYVSSKHSSCLPSVKGARTLISSVLQFRMDASTSAPGTASRRIPPVVAIEAAPRSFNLAPRQLYTSGAALGEQSLGAVFPTKELGSWSLPLFLSSHPLYFLGAALGQKGAEL